MGTYTFDWWHQLDPEFNCTQDELESSLEQTILTDLLPLSTSGEITISGIVSSKLSKKIISFYKSTLKPVKTPVGNRPYCML